MNLLSAAQSLDKGRMWWYNILRDNKGSISYCLHIDPITEGYFLLTSNIIFMKRENTQPILTVKIIERRKLIDYFGLIIEADPSRVGKKNIYFVCIESTTIPSSVQLHISRHYLDKDLNLELPNLRLYQQTKNLAAEIVPHISSAFIDLGTIFEKYHLSISPKFVDADPEGTVDS